MVRKSPYPEARQTIIPLPTTIQLPPLYHLSPPPLSLYPSQATPLPLQSVMHTKTSEILQSTLNGKDIKGKVDTFVEGRKEIATTSVERRKEKGGAFVEGRKEIAATLSRISSRQF